jgi:hypothetical protein
VLLEDYIRELAKARPKAARRTLPPQPQLAGEPFELRPDDAITITRLMARLNESLDSQTVVIADVGDALFSATELVVQTLFGAATMMRETGQHPTVLREQVTSPGGTTAAALRQLDDHKVRAAFITAMEAAANRSRPGQDRREQEKARCGVLH